ncbi:MAG: protein kinase [Isosphaeraceae bacterium]
MTVIVHRDLKPENILFPDRTLNGPRIADLGLASAIEAEAEARARDDAAAPRRGPRSCTLRRAARSPSLHNARAIRPRALGPIGPSSDIFALGVMLYEIAVGRRPFQSMAETLAGKPIPPRVAAPRRVDRNLDAVIMKAIAPYLGPLSHRQGPGRRPSERLDDYPVKARRASFGEQLAAVARRNRAAATFLVAMIASLVLGIAGTTWYAVQADRERGRVVAEKSRADRNARRRVDTLVQLSERFDGPQHFGRPPSVRICCEWRRKGSTKRRARTKGSAMPNWVVPSLRERRSTCCSARSPTLWLTRSARARLFASLPPTYENRVGLARGRVATGGCFRRPASRPRGPGSPTRL